MMKKIIEELQQDPQLVANNKGSYWETYIFIYNSSSTVQ